MIKSYWHKGLEQLFRTGRSSRVAPDLQKRCLKRLDAMHNAKKLSDLNLPGWNLHSLHTDPVRYTLHVNGPWCITFEWVDGDAWRVDLEQYH